MEQLQIQNQLLRHLTVDLHHLNRHQLFPEQNHQLYKNRQ